MTIHRLRREVAAFTVGLMLALTAGLGIVAAAPAQAFWTDTASGTQALTAGTIPAPTISCGFLTIASTPFSWTAVPGATSYEFRYTENGASSQTFPATTTSTLRTGLIETGDAWVYALRNFGQVTWGSDHSNVLGYSVALFLIGACGPGDHPAGPWPYTPFQFP